jgi:hypothetical protein
LTRRPRRIETVEVPKLIEGSAPISEPSRSAPVEVRTIVTKEPKMEKTTEELKVLSPPWRNGIAAGVKHPRNNSKKKENG